MKMDVKLDQLSRRLRGLRLGYRLVKKWKSALGREKSLDMATMTGFYKTVWGEAAKEISAELFELAEGVWEVRRGARSTLIHNYIVQIDDPVVLHLAGHKPLCYRLLMKEGLPVPEHRVYTLHQLEKAKAFMEGRAGEFFVVKPAVGT
ncbi:MAG TPA: hypothetical protein VIK48_02865, partial [Candidatus Manganitrophaceae bacterium]